MRRTHATLLALLLLALPTQARAMDKDVFVVLRSGFFGIAGGTALGLVSYPFTQSTRGIFQGSSIGLYLGLAIGLFTVWDHNYMATLRYGAVEGQPRPRKQDVGCGSPTACLPLPAVEASFALARF